MKIDLVGPRGRGLALGFNEAAGYLAVGATALATGCLAAAYGLRPVPELTGVAYAAAGLALSVLVVRDTAGHVAAETATPRSGRGGSGRAQAVSLTPATRGSGSARSSTAGRLRAPRRTSCAPPTARRPR
jgi:hypothetical protein